MTAADTRPRRTDTTNRSRARTLGPEPFSGRSDHRDSAASDGVGAFDRGWRSRANAALFSAIDRYAAHVAQWHEHVAFDGLTESSIVEIGPGVGANFAWYPAGATVWAIEPNAAMHRSLSAGRRSGVLRPRVARGLRSP